ncbi:glycosylated lysosomal membrane protein isoform X1 [Archocentrus centrarchus]|uniref:glycosylated lysosomal membrane protein isoform X1 n=1 Tax=Archocentrus centrarchus TaxID=63155 RepID=UPI0011EA0A6D|nr:glycosylated lysosomal membrane protein isoform X1 [Archocentrus centrarchus]
MMATGNTRSGGFLVLCAVIVTCSADPGHRQLFIQVNPGSNSTPPLGDLLHVRAVGDNDTLHFLFCSQGAPTLLFVHTNSSSSNVQVNWTQFLAPNTSGSLKVEPESSVLYSSAIVFSRLLEYDDVNNTAEPTSEFFPPYDLQNFTWNRLNLSGHTALLCGADASFTNGSLCLQLSVFDSEGRSQSLPHLLHSVNSSQLELRLDGVPARAAQSRFLLELQAVGGDYPLSRMEVHESIDDEYTPSIFKVSRWVSSVNGSSDVLGFAQWKPVAYRHDCPALEDATPCRHSAPRAQSGAAVMAASGLIRGFFSDPESVALNVSFGLAGEPFYNSTHFLSWTLLVGVGSPPVDFFSPLVVAIMAVGLGTPLILILVGGVWVCVHKRRAAASYEPIN